MPVDRTRLKSRGLDRKRARLGLGDDLAIERYVAATGYETVETITGGWSGEKVTDRALGQEFFEVKIADDGPVDLTALFRENISHLKVGEYRYKKQGVEQPRQEAVKVWLIRCSPTGERVPA